MELRERKDMDTAYQWKLTDIFADEAAYEAAFAKAEEAVRLIDGVKGTLGKSAKNLKAGLDIIYSASEQVELLYIYSMLAKSGDNGDAKHQEREGKAVGLYVAFSTAVSFLEPEILAIPEKKLASYMKNKDLALYLHTIDDITRARKHTLDAEREKMLAMLGNAAQCPSDSYDMLTSVDMILPKIKGASGEEEQLTHGNFGVFRECKDTEVRHGAFRAYLGEYKKYINTFAALYGGQVKLDCYNADVRGYDSACEAALFANNVPVSVYDSLTAAIHDALPTMRRYIELRKKALGLGEIGMFDMYVPMVDDVEMGYTFDEAKELVKKALEPLGEGYQKLLDKAYAEQWMDVYENKGKSTGAFSCGVYGFHPFVMLNYTDTLDDAFTMAHELGHAMHSYLSSEKQEYVNHDYKITVAEVASTVNEVLLTKYLLKTETDPKRKAYILNHFLEGFRTTVLRQTLFAEFERKAHDLCKQGEPLTAQTLCKVYRDLETTYYDGAVVDELMDYEWAYIPHFYRNFYVYQYATGFCSAVAIAEKILNEGAAEKYLEFLSTGGSDYPLNELKIMGIDLTQPDTVASAMKVFDDTVRELEELMA
ncbi:MAG: oligoendopeptidase F [Ruminococcaceae bacterium]|nr:oligoendopeptidase F [Oscillospiraceae bacterium]